MRQGSLGALFLCAVSLAQAQQPVSQLESDLFPAAVRFRHVKVAGKLQVERVKTQKELQHVRSSERLSLLPARGSKVSVHRLELLRGHVRVESAEAALEFVRLRSSVETFHLMRGAWGVIEILPEDRYHQRHDYAFERIASDDWPRTDGTNGVVREKTWEKFGLTEPKVETIESGFLVRRPVVVQKFGSSRILDEYMAYDFVEFVGRDGTYKVVNKTSLPDVVLDWSFKSREYQRLFH